MTGNAGTAHLRDGGLLEVRHLEQRFRLPSGDVVHAVSDVSFDVFPGETLGLVGESGCGKSTAVRSILQAPRPTGGTVRFGSVELTSADSATLRDARRSIQLVFQDPHSSLNPRWTVEECLMEPLDVHRVGDRRSRQARVRELVELVGLEARAHLDRRPGQLSGGQCQRVGIARALALAPELVLFDEAVSSLDVSIQAQILNLIGDLQRELSLTSVFIAHDLAVVKHVSDRVGVMYLGALCEIGPADEIYRSPAHPYTAALLSSIPQPDPAHGSRHNRTQLVGDLPSPVDPPSGCRFRTRCLYATEECAAEQPAMREFQPGQFAACHHPLQPPRAREA
ncbi:MAG: ATP-binding cassette domain-containing protein [Actinobacteria bacterium]|nr:ATP-binding cassette domain-containing protein [Actinomycetota bacterium]